MTRVRTVEGSCWSCKRRRIKCNLTKPCCRQCRAVGAECVYGSVLVRWDARPNAFQARMGIPNAPRPPCAPIGAYQKRALEYFEYCLWPLFTAERDPCSFPIDVAVRGKTELQAICVIADAHRYLLDKRYSSGNVQLRRVDVLTSVRQELCNNRALSNTQRQHLLSAVLLLYFLDGYIDCKREVAATMLHQSGIRAIIAAMGGYDEVLASANDALRLLISEFATADLSTAMFRGTEPYFPAETWTSLSTYRVWWASNPQDALRLCSLFQDISAMVSYGRQIQSTGEATTTAATERVMEYEAAFCPTFDSVSCPGLQQTPPGPADEDYVLRREFLHIFQHCALIYLYRVLCRYPPNHHFVQQHVQAAVGKIIAMDAESKLLNCVLLPICVAGAHLRNPNLQRLLFGQLEAIHRHLKFESVACIKQWISGLWDSESLPEGWTELFADLNPQAVVI